MKDYINNIKRERDAYGHYWNAPIQFADGFSISIQASEYHYCSPKRDMAQNQSYSSFEVQTDDACSIQSFVSRADLNKLIEAAIEKHGPIVTS